MIAPPLPIANIEAFLAVIGQWNLYDMEIRGVRYRAPQVGTGTLELDFYLLSTNVRPTLDGELPTEFEFVFRFEGAEGLSIDDFAGSIVAESAFEVRQISGGGPKYIDVSLNSTSVGDIRFLCRSVTVASVRELSVRSAV